MQIKTDSCSSKNYKKTKLKNLYSNLKSKRTLFNKTSHKSAS